MIYRQSQDGVSRREVCKAGTVLGGAACIAPCGANLAAGETAPRRDLGSGGHALEASALGESMMSSNVTHGTHTSKT